MSNLKKDYYDNISLYKNFDFSNYKNKSSFENGVIFMSTNPNKSDWELEFLNKYNLYLENILKKDIRQCFNNSYCLYKYVDLIKRIDRNKYDKYLFLKNIKLSDIDERLSHKLSELMNKNNKGKPLDREDMSFILKTFYLDAFNSGIYKKKGTGISCMQDVINYFSNHSLNEKSSNMDRFYYLMNEMCKRLVKIEGNNGFKFVSKKTGNMATHEKMKDGRTCIKLYDFDVSRLSMDNEFIKKVYAGFHEIVHAKQYSKNNGYSSEDRDLLKMEAVICDYAPEFYYKYSDSFFCEIDARSKACTDINRLLGKKYSDIIKRLINKINSFEVIERNKFVKMEFEVYEDIVSSNHKRR